LFHIRLNVSPYDKVHVLLDPELQFFEPHFDFSFHCCDSSLEQLSITHHQLTSDATAADPLQTTCNPGQSTMVVWSHALNQKKLIIEQYTNSGQGKVSRRFET